MQTLKRAIEMMPTSNNGGFTMAHVTEWMLKNAPEESWAHFYHKPYQNDWNEAKKLGRERLAKEGLIPTEVKSEAKATIKKPMPTFSEEKIKRENIEKKEQDKNKLKYGGVFRMGVKKSAIDNKDYQVITFVTDDKRPKSYIVVRGIKSKDLAIEIANKEYFKIGKAKMQDKLTAIDVWTLGDDLYISRPNMSAKKEIAVIRK